MPTPWRNSPRRPTHRPGRSEPFVEAPSIITAGRLAIALSEVALGMVSGATADASSAIKEKKVKETAERPEKAAAELNGPQREKLLIDHLPQVQYIARRIHSRLPPQVLLEDLVHAGILGLMDAVRKYDPSKNVQLKHYAEFRIRGAILDSLRQVDWSPRALRRQARRLEQAVLDCKARLGRDPTEPEIAAELQITLESLHHLLGDLRGLDIGSLQADANDPNGDELAAQNRPAADQEDPYHLTLREEMSGLLEKTIGELPGRERQVLALYHFEGLTMKEVGAVLGIGESRVSQIHTTAVIRLRARLRELIGNGFKAAQCAAPRIPNR